MKECLKPNSFDNRTLIKKLKNRFGQKILVIRDNGKIPLIVYQSYDISKSCEKWFRDTSALNDLEKRSVISVSAGIIREEIKNTVFKQTDSYPPGHNFLHDVKTCVPPLLNFFLSELLNYNKQYDTDGETKAFQAKYYLIAHSILSIIKKASFFSMLQLSIATYVYRKSNTRLLVDFLSKFGVTSSYYNERLFEASAASDLPEAIFDEVFVQQVFDNTDHNVRTLDGRETFHCLGGISIYTPAQQVAYVGTIKKLRKMPDSSTLSIQQQIPEKPIGKINEDGLKNIIFTDPKKMSFGKLKLIEPNYTVYLWGKMLRIPGVPSWKGFFEILSRDSSYVQSHIHFLPFINAPPSQLKTLNTALHYANKQCLAIGQKTCIVTFDQPLYYKARTIIANSKELCDIILRLGGFHFLMSFLGSIGNIMSGSGLDDCWSVIYALESIKQMLLGHAFARSVRAHILTYTALGIIICKNINAQSQLTNHIRDLFSEKEKLRNGQFWDDHKVQDLTRLFESELTELEKRGPTAKLWVQYFKLVTLALQFIDAERRADWTAHLQSAKEMLPIFHAAGHYAYAKSAHIYLQDMDDLSSMDDLEEKQFKDAFAVSQSDKPWCGVWSDMAIEQSLNRHFGQDLKHGRGVTKSVIARYLLPMPTVCSMMIALEDFCGIEAYSSEQHVDISDSRIKRDNDDIEKLVYWFEKHNPFPFDKNLTSISTGVISDQSIDCHQAFEKGMKGVDSMIGKNLQDISLGKLYKVKPMSLTSNGTHLHHEDSINIDPIIMFQRISVFLQGTVN